MSLGSVYSTRAIGVDALFLLGFLGLDFLARQIPVASGIQVWNPAAGLLFAYLFARGWFGLPAAHLAVLVAGLWSGGGGIAVSDVTRAAVYPWMYLAAAGIVRGAGIDLLRPGLRSISTIVVVAVVAAALLTLAHMVALPGPVRIATDAWARDAFSFWAAEVTGVLSLAPALLVWSGAELERLTMGASARDSLEQTGQAERLVPVLLWTAALGGTAIATRFIGDTFDTTVTYLLSLPLAGAAGALSFRRFTLLLPILAAFVFLAIPSTAPSGAVAGGQLFAAAVLPAGLIAAAAIDRLRREAAEKQVYAAIARAASRFETVADVGPALTTGLRAVVPFDRIEVLEADASSQQGRCVYQAGTRLPGSSTGRKVQSLFHDHRLREPGGRFELSGDLPGWALARRPEIRDGGLRSYLEAPISWNNRIIGYVVLLSVRRNAFGLRDGEFLLRTIDYVGPAITHARLLAELEDRVVDRTKQLEEANQAKTRILSVVSHELKTPLTSIIGFSELFELQAGGLTEQQRRWLTLIHENGLLLDRLVDDLLDASRLDEGRLNLDRSVIDLGRLVRDAADSLRPLIEGKKQKLTVEVFDSDLEVYADSMRIRQVCLNLMSNASKYSPRGSLISVEAFRMNGAVSVAVTDCGMGITEGDQKMLFTPFYRSSNPTAQAMPGTGLGLAVSRGIAELHGGTLSVTSVFGRGSTFTLTLPATEHAGNQG